VLPFDEASVPRRSAAHFHQILAQDHTEVGDELFNFDHLTGSNLSIVGWREAKIEFDEARWWDLAS
jgi:hypothetical protein